MSFSSVQMWKERCDTFGIGISGLCLVHCLLSPLVFVLFPAAEAYVPADDATHHAFGLIVLVTGTVAFFRGYALHRQSIVLALLITGMAVLVIGTFGHHFIREERLSGALVMSGSFVLVAAHLLNRTFCRLCKSCQHS
jgi:hypothetical protein